MTGIGQWRAAAAKPTLARKARRKTEDAQDARPFKWLVRAGFLSRGITYALVGGLALALAVGAGTTGAAASQQGASRIA